MEVFREWPYLYEGCLEYESRYLKNYGSSQAMIAIAFDGDKPVGASTAIPLAEHGEASLLELATLGLASSDVYYFGESVLARPYRGRGIGHRFFEEREQQALALGFSWAAFCAVERAEGHPLKPADYVPHDAFWKKCGFVRHPELVSLFGWKDLGDTVETQKPMVYWLKQLRST
jgi:GNAT superfamily N-acetyltransferase